MSDDIHSWVVLLLVACILMLAGINLYMVMQQIKEQRSELPALPGSHSTSLDYERHLEHVAGQLNLIQGALGELKTQVPAAVDSADGEVDTHSFFQLDAELNESLVQMEHAGSGTEALLLDLQQVEIAELSAWRDLNAERVTELIRQQKQLRGRVATLQGLLSEANATILTLRSRTRRNPISDALGDGATSTELQQIRADNARLNSELSTAKANAQMLDERVATRELMLAEAGEQHDKERAALDAQIAELQAKIQSMQASFDRTLVEKTFIEDAFLEEIEGSKKR